MQCLLFYSKSDNSGNAGAEAEAGAEAGEEGTDGQADSGEEGINVTVETSARGSASPEGTLSFG